MRVNYSTVLIASDNLALGRVGFGATWNGEPVIDPVPFFRSAVTKVFGRRDGPETFGISVRRFFASEAAAISFCGTHRATLPLQADLVLVDQAESVAVRMADAVRAVQVVQRKGVAVLVEYKFTGSLFETDDVPEDSTIPSADTVKTGQQALSIGDTTATVTFPVAFGAAPKFPDARVSVPTDGEAISASVIKDTITASGYQVKLGASVPADGYFLHWFAAL